MEERVIMLNKSNLDVISDGCFKYYNLSDCGDIFSKKRLESEIYDNLELEWTYNAPFRN